VTESKSLISAKDHLWLHDVTARSLRTSLLAVIFCLRHLPKFLVPALAACGRALFILVARKEYRQLQINIHKVLGLPPHSRFARLFARQCLGHQLLCQLETLRAVYDEAAISIEGTAAYAAYLREAAAAGKGLVVISGHIGAWELMAKYSAQGFPGKLSVLAKPAPLRGVTYLLEDFRRRMQVNVLWTNSMRLLRQMLGVLQKGDALGFVMDQKPEGRVGHQVEFMGLPAAFVSGPAMLSLRSRCPVVAGFVVRTGPWRYRLLFKEIAPPDHQFSDELALTTVMVKEIEKIVKLYPEQWTWNYRRWKFS